MINTDLMNALIAHANKHHDGHLTVLKFTTNWRISFLTPCEREEIDEMAVGKTFEDAAFAALRKDIVDEMANQIISVQPIDPKPFMDFYQLLRDNPGKALVFMPKHG